jgi:hypothetical protein
LSSSPRPEEREHCLTNNIHTNTLKADSSFGPSSSSVPQSTEVEKVVVDQQRPKRPKVPLFGADSFGTSMPGPISAKKNPEASAGIGSTGHQEKTTTIPPANGKMSALPGLSAYVDYDSDE